MTAVTTAVERVRAAISVLLPVTTRNTPDYAEVDFGSARSQTMALEPETFLALNDIPAVLSQNDRLRSALERQADNIAFLLNHAPIVQPWYDKFTAELAEDRTALQQTEA